jgi:hypothetical protein
VNPTSPLMSRAVPGGWAARATAAGPCHEGAHGVCICRVISICNFLIVKNIQKLIYMHVVPIRELSLLSPPISVFSYSLLLSKNAAC